MSSRIARQVPGFPVVVNRPVVFGAICWTLSIVFFAAQIVVEAASGRPYSLSTNVISDLGNTSCGASICSPLHPLMNVTFIVVGLLHWAGAVGTQQAWPRFRLAIAILIALAGWSLAYVGVFPENVAPSNHVFGALLGLTSLNVGMIVLGLALLPSSRFFGALTFAAGIVGGLAFIVFLTDVLGLPRGLTERLADYPAAAMIVVLGVALLIRSRRGRSRIS